MKTVDKIIDKIEEYGIFLFASTMFILIILQVFFRYVLKHPFPWAEELARYCMIWATYIGVSACTKTNDHVGVDGFVMMLPKAIRQGIQVLVVIIVVILNATIFVLAIQLTSTIMQRGQTSPALILPMWLAYLALPVGFGLSTYRSIRSLWKSINKIFTKEVQGGIN